MRCSAPRMARTVQMVVEKCVGASVAGEDVLVGGDAVADGESELAGVPSQVG